MTKHGADGAILAQPARPPSGSHGRGDGTPAALEAVRPAHPDAGRFATSGRSRIVVCVPAQKRRVATHERVTHAGIGERLARLLGLEFGGDYDPERRYGRPLYAIPVETLVADRAAALGIESGDDLLGGVVPHAFVATKVITHPLPDGAAAAPTGWEFGFADDVRHAVLPGFTAFDAADAKRAGASLMCAGPVRVKRPSGIGGSGQSVAKSVPELHRVLDAIGGEEIARDGVVLERDLSDVTTYSIGKLQVPGARIAYAGTQRTARNHGGAVVYGGSDIRLVRGDFDALLDAMSDPGLRQAVEHARTYDRAAARHYPGLIVSRCNYDVACGRAGGEWQCGVLEQSWRIGGATPAEITALPRFLDRSRTRGVRAASHEVYGHCDVPEGADVYFDGVDPQLGRLVKYAQVHGCADEA